eukprot:GFYU01006478.1.p1 GENE.GFYU01006478.1~~GFYU01006478.1.p1  ORF type:complete len:203 (+),score=54.10 GFYU01006478.1:127-735(+)
MDIFDTDGDGNVSVAEMMHIMKEIQAVFREFDRDNHGTLSYAEFAEGCHTLGLEFTREELFSLYRQFDHNRDDKVNMHEFVQRVPKEFLAAYRAKYGIAEFKDEKVEKTHTETTPPDHVNETTATELDPAKIIYKRGSQEYGKWQPTQYTPPTQHGLNGRFTDNLGKAGPPRYQGLNTAPSRHRVLPDPSFLTTPGFQERIG